MGVFALWLVFKISLDDNIGSDGNLIEMNMYFVLLLIGYAHVKLKSRGERVIQDEPTTQSSAVETDHI